MRQAGDGARSSGGCKKIILQINWAKGAAPFRSQTLICGALHFNFLYKNFVIFFVIPAREQDQVRIAVQGCIITDHGMVLLSLLRVEDANVEDLC